MLTIALATLGGVALNFTSIDPIKALYWSAVVNGVLAAPLMTVMMVMAMNPRYYGATDSSPAYAHRRLDCHLVNTPAMGRNASAAWEDVWISVTPAAFNVAAVAKMMNKAMRFETPIPKNVSMRMRESSAPASRGLCTAA